MTKTKGDREKNEGRKQGSRLSGNCGPGQLFKGILESATPNSIRGVVPNFPTRLPRALTARPPRRLSSTSCTKKHPVTSPGAQPSTTEQKKATNRRCRMGTARPTNLHSRSPPRRVQLAGYFGSWGR